MLVSEERVLAHSFIKLNSVNFNDLTQKKNHLHTHHLDHQMPQIYINMTLIAEAGMLERLIKRLMLF